MYAFREGIIINLMLKRKKTYGNKTSIVDEDVRTNVLTWTEQVRPSCRLMAEEGKDNKRSTRT